MNELKIEQEVWVLDAYRPFYVEILSCKVINPIITWTAEPQVKVERDGSSVYYNKKCVLPKTKENHDILIKEAIKYLERCEKHCENELKVAKARTLKFKQKHKIKCC